jgi:hypothetical protein
MSKYKEVHLLILRETMWETASMESMGKKVEILLSEKE